MWDRLLQGEQSLGTERPRPVGHQLVQDTQGAGTRQLPCLFTA